MDTEISECLCVAPIGTVQIALLFLVHIAFNDKRKLYSYLLIENTGYPVNL